MLLSNAILLSLILFTWYCHSFIITSPPTREVHLPQHAHQRYHPALLLRVTITNKDETWEWDGIVKEGAHDDEFESIDNIIGEEEVFVPSIGFMSAVATLSVSSSGNVDIDGSSGVVTATQSSAISFDPLLNCGMIHRLSSMNEDANDNMSEDDLLEMGGDPDFLGDGVDDTMDHKIGSVEDLNDSAIIFEWDGIVDEDAHLDM